MYSAPSPDAPRSVSWVEAEAKLKARMTAAGLRPSSVKYYLRVLGYLKAFCTEAHGPGDVTPARAQDWADHYSTAPARRKKARSGHTAVSVIDAVTAIFQKWLLDELKLRKRAFSASWEKKIDPRKAAIAIGCNVDTMMKHYVALDEQATTDEVFAELTPTLRRTASHTTPSVKKGDVPACFPPSEDIEAER